MVASWFDNSVVAGQTLIARFDGIATALGLLAPKANPTFTGTVTAPAFSGELTGNASTATTLQTARTINGAAFNGSTNITVNTANTLTRGGYLTGANFNGGAATTWAVDATPANTASKVVARDASGDFSAGTITASLAGDVSGPAVTATGAVTGGRFVTTAGGTLTINGGIISVTNGYHAVDTQAAAATDDLDTINGGTAGMMLILRAANSARDVVVKKGTGNLRIVSDFTLSHVDDRLVLLGDGSGWVELSRSDNAV